ncbi:hypothetical protein GSI_03544 [Ganoderma sinense ZZ0214-1]|uniref:EF-hand domain-containing protein n=1 Tax=Ganoderma sinense ZZ0214-1 TaxID=1077348 RepID=A0A2G8SJW6_9APHY|nr:hypothetical protein GSI_03544 [Ganoderma sinense ZZ0214-1]
MPPIFGKHSKTPVSPSQCPDTTATPSSATPEPEPVQKPDVSLSSITVPPEATHGKEEEDHEASDMISGAFQAVAAAKPAFEHYDSSKWRKRLDRAGEAIDTAQEKVETAKSVEELVKPAYDSDVMQPVKDGINKLVDSLPGLLKALNEVAQIHPFIAIAVGAFRVVVELDVRRRDNDRKVVMLFVEMSDMMKALLQLRGIKDRESVGLDGLTVEGRMQELVDETAADIKECANTCDTYARKKLLTKVFQSSSWDDTFKGFITLFAQRRKDFTFALQMHTSMSVDEVNEKVREIDAKLSMLLEIFPRIVSPEQQELAALVKKKGGPEKILGDNDVLEGLLAFKPTTALDRNKRGSGAGQDGAERNGHQDEAVDLPAVKQELFDSPESAIKKNWEAFERRFNLQEKRLTDNLAKIVRRDGDRVIQAVTAGPHDRILDPDIHEIWKDMKWPGHVKARHFVFALRDYYRQQVKRKHEPHLRADEASHADEASCPGETPRLLEAAKPESRVADEDEWAVGWISINRLQSILEAFDDDASGLITIEEVNYFTTSRPKEWSLPHWLAYWAIGWQMAATKYRDMIVGLFAKMVAIRPHIHPLNRNAVDKYLNTVWQKVTTLTLSFVGADQPNSDSLQERFRSYVEAEEKRLREGLETVQYDIDAMDTVWLVTGPGRIEKHLFPLLWLLLSRDFEIFRLCQHTVIHKDELWDSADTILWVLDAVSDRHNDLENLFKQQKLDPESQFKAVAKELYEYWHYFDTFWALDNQRDRDFDEVEYDDAKEDPNVDDNKLRVLNYPLAPTAEDLYPLLQDDCTTEFDAVAEEPVRSILGRWHGVQILENEGMLSMPIMFSFHVPETDRSGKTYEAKALTTNGTDYTILGDHTTRGDGTVEYSFTKTYAARFRTTYWTSTLADGGQTLTGRWGYTKDDKPHTFAYTRVPPEVLHARPPPEEFAENRIGALWKYARTAIRAQVRRRRCAFSWRDLEARRDVREEYLELLLKEADGQLTKDDMARSTALARLATCDDVRCFYLIHEYRLRSVRPHFGITCDECGDLIRGTRMVCLECDSDDTFDFCDEPECIGGVGTKRGDIGSGRPHRPTHDFVKIRVPIVDHREISRILRKAKAGLQRARNLLEQMENRSWGVEYVGSVSDQTKDGMGVEEHGEGVEARWNVEDDESQQDEEETGNILTCLACKVPISPPCLYCTDCPDEPKPFICWECEDQTVDLDPSKSHLATHNLVPCMSAVKEEQTDDYSGLWPGVFDTGKRLGALENKLEGLTNQMERIEKLLHDLANATGRE